MTTAGVVSIYASAACQKSAACKCSIQLHCAIATCECSLHLRLADGPTSSTNNNTALLSHLLTTRIHSNACTAPCQPLCCTVPAAFLLCAITPCAFLLQQHHTCPGMGTCSCQHLPPIPSP